MKTLSLLIVLCSLKIFLLADKGIPHSPWDLPIFLAQDSLLCILFAIVEFWLSERPVKYLYALCIVYSAINIPLWRAISTPFTPLILSAAGGPLRDSFLAYANLANASAVLVTLAAGFFLPKLLPFSRQAPHSTTALGLILSLVIFAMGIRGIVTIDTVGFDRNPILVIARALLEKTRVLSRLGAPSFSKEDPYASWTDQSLSYLQGKFAGRSVVHVILESTSASYLKTYGALEDPMPYFTQLSSRGIIFENTYCAYPESIKGLFSILCSTYPVFDSKAEEYQGHGPSSIAEVLKRQGYQTALFHAGRFDYLGMNAIIQERGFDLLEDAGDIGGNHHSSFGISDERVVVRRMLQWVDSLKSRQPFYLLYLPAAGHHPYVSPEKGPFPGTAEIDYYRNALYHSDTALRLLVEGLKSRSLGQEPLIVIHADHGEAFRQHTGNSVHSLFIYDENVRVPFIIVPPDNRPFFRVKHPTSLIDVAPTVLALLGIPIPEGYQGISQIHGRRKRSFFFTDYSLGLLGLREGAWKYIFEVEKKRSQLFNLATDVKEQRDRSREFAEKTAIYQGLVLGWAADQKKMVFGKK